MSLVKQGGVLVPVLMGTRSKPILSMKPVPFSLSAKGLSKAGTDTEKYTAEWEAKALLLL